MPAQRYSGVALATIVVLVLVLVAAFARLRPATLTLATLGAGLAAGSLCLAAGSLCLAVACRPPKTPALGGGRGAGGTLRPFHEEMLTAGEVAEIKKVLPRQPMARLPAAVADLRASLPYRRGIYRRRLPPHIGQRKLLLSEVDFLTDFARKGDTVVYAGSAPGIHLPFLASLFHSKALRFELYDPRKFLLPKGRAEANSRITARREFFTDETAASYAGRDDVLFISDVRTGTDEVDIPTEGTVAADMALQEGWVLAMQPRAAMLKFRLPYGGAPVEYLDGVPRCQAWSGNSSAETRLTAVRASHGYSRVVYDPAAYERQMFYLNAVVREWASYDHGVPLDLVPGLDYCYGCALEAHIWKKYLGRASTPANVATLFNRTTKAISRGLELPPHGVDPELAMPERRARLLKFKTEEGLL